MDTLPATTLTVGGKHLFAVTALDQNDNPLQDVEISWTVSNSAVGNVDTTYVLTNVTGGATSTFTALVAGTTMVNATNGSVAGTAVVTVKNPTLIPSITVISPNGGENLRRGTTQTIRWNSSGSPGAYVKIELLKSGILNRVIISSTLNDGSYTWLIPATQTLGDNYKIKITSTANLSNNDTSDNNFSIILPEIRVSSPDGGENWAGGTAHAITWNYTGNTGVYVKIELLKNGLFNKIIFSSTLNDKSQTWTIPMTQTPGADYKVRITSTTNSAYNDTSSNNFTIA